MNHSDWPWKIPLTRGKCAIVDGDDYVELSKFKWHCHHLGYAARNIPSDNKKRQIWRTMHRLLIGDPPQGMEIDHINGNKLDNRRQNLRVVTKAQNGMNRSLYKNNTSGLKGVRWHKRARVWCATIQAQGRSVWLGQFRDKNEAHEAYLKAAKQLFGEFARTT